MTYIPARAGGYSHSLISPQCGGPSVDGVIIVYFIYFDDDEIYG